MFKPLYCLSSDADGRLKLVPAGRRSFRATVIVPRELCVFESLPAQGVAWHELTTFARLQAKRLAPFVETGANAVARGRRVMFWFWDANEVNAAIRNAGQEPAAFRKLAEPLMLPLPGTPGTHTLNCGAGVDLLTVVDQAIVSSVWQGSRSIRDRPLPWLATPWGRDRLSAKHVGADAGNRSLPQRVLAAGAALALIAAAGHLAYWRARVDVASERLAQRSEASTLASGALAQLSELRRKEKTQSTWLQSYDDLGAGLDSSALLKALTPALQAQGTVVRELEIQGAQLRLLLVAAGGDLNVPKVLSALDGIPGIRSVQLQQNPDVAQGSFLMNIDGFRRPARASVGKELP